MGMESFAAVSDLHGDRQDPDAVKKFKRFVADFRPKHRFFLGDLWDFRAIRVGADAEEKRHSMRQDFKAGTRFLEWYRPQVITLGNHDQRLYDLVFKDGLHRSGPLADLASILLEDFEKLTKRLRITVLPYNKRTGVWRGNGLKMTHGFDGLSSLNMAKTYGNVLYGHGHSIEQSPAPGDESVKVARMIGALCQLDMDYNRAQTKTLKQEHGWAYGAFLGGNRHEVLQARVNADQVVYADHLKVIQ